MTKAPVRNILFWLPCYMLPALALLTLTYFVPALNPLPPSHFDLTGGLGLAAYWIAESGGRFGVPVIGLGMTAFLVSRSGISGKQRAVEALIVVLAVALLLGGGAYLNEHMVKPYFAIPRPNILELADTGNGAPALKMSAKEFYDLPDKATRSEYLDKVLTPEIPLHKQVRQHWIAETGYSFPSGHSFSAMMFATFFLAMGLSYFSGRRLWVFYLLVVWAVAVCLSRPILRVHSPTDICVAGCEGVAAGIITFLIVRWILVVAYPRKDRTPVNGVVI